MQTYTANDEAWKQRVANEILCKLKYNDRTFQGKDYTTNDYKGK